MYNEDFVYCTPTGEEEIRLIAKATGNYLFTIKGCSNIRLYVHLDNVPKTTFYCIYRPANIVKGFEIIDNELRTEESLGQPLQRNTYFNDLRIRQKLEHIGWEERMSPISDIEKDILKQLSLPE